ncbi:hypothetical protein ACOMHN_059049 [Nucella lapillus]
MAAALASVRPKRPSASDNIWWRPISELINRPCLPLSDKNPHFPSPVLNLPNMSEFGSARKGDCLPLNRSSFRAATKETQDQVDKLLRDKRIKITEDLIQLASYAHYLDKAVTSPALKGKKNSSIRTKTAELSRKLKILACSMRPSVEKDTMSPYVNQDDVPADLRRQKRRRSSRVVIYIIWENLETFLQDLPGSYKKAGFKLCKT